MHKRCMWDMWCSIQRSGWKSGACNRGKPGRAEFRYEGEEYRISLGGVYQKENAVLAIETLKMLSEIGFPTTEEQRKDGLFRTRWNGRFTVLSREPLFIVDGAHNPAAAEKMASSIRHYFDGKKIYFIIGMFRDKDYREVLSKTCPYAEKIFTIEAPDNPRALPAEELALAAREFHRDVQAMKSVEEAVETAYSLAGEEDVILAFGSLSFIGILSETVEKRRTNKECWTYRNAEGTLIKIDEEILLLFQSDGNLRSSSCV